MKKPVLLLLLLVIAVVDEDEVEDGAKQKTHVEELEYFRLLLLFEKRAVGEEDRTAEAIFLLHIAIDSFLLKDSGKSSCIF